MQGCPLGQLKDKLLTRGSDGKVRQTVVYLKYKISQGETGFYFGETNPEPIHEVVDDQTAAKCEATATATATATDEEQASAAAFRELGNCTAD